MKKLSLLFWLLIVCLGVHAQKSLSVTFEISPCNEVQYGRNIKSIKSFKQQYDTLHLEMDVIENCAFDPFRDSLYAVLRHDSLFLDHILRKKHWDDTYDIACNCCYGLSWKIALGGNSYTTISYKNTPISAYGNPAQYMYRQTVKKEDLGHRRYLKIPDSTNHSPNANGYSGSYIFDDNSLRQLIQRPFSNTEKCPSPCYYYSFTHKDSLIEVIGEFGKGIAGRISVGDSIVHISMPNGYFFRTIPDTNNLVKRVEVIFPDGHIEVWP